MANTATQNREITRQRQAEEAEAYRALYGAVLPAVELLRKRGYIVTREGDQIRVGNKLLTPDEVAAMAVREGARAGMTLRSVQETASGLKIGQSVPLTPKKTAPAAGSSAPRKLSGAAAASVAMAAEHSTDLGTRPQVVWVDLGLLTVDRTYQREITDKGNTHVNRILKEFNWNCYQPIIVTAGADGTYAVIDGQHRLLAAKKHPLIDTLPCYVIDAPEVTRQAAVFVAVNSVRKALTSQQKFWAAIAAGDETAIVTADICRGAGVTILRTAPTGQVPPMSLSGPIVCQRLVARFGRGPLREAIRLLAETNAKTPNAFRSAIVTGLTRIAADQGFSRDRLRAVLAGFDLSALIGEAHTLANGGNVGLAVERIVRAALKGRAA